MVRFDRELTRKRPQTAMLRVQLFTFILIAVPFRFHQLGFGGLTVLCCFYGPNCLRLRGGLETDLRFSIHDAKELRSSIDVFLYTV